MKANKIRLIVTDKCPKNCEGCCNKDHVAEKRKKFDRDAFMISLMEYDNCKELIITGGEPMLFPSEVINLLMETKVKRPDVKRYMYTALTKDPVKLLFILQLLDGLVVTIHDQEDWEPFIKFNKMLMEMRLLHKDYLKDVSLRLHVFTKDNIPTVDLSFWKVKFIEWIVDCPLPSGEILYELKEKY